MITKVVYIISKSFIYFKNIQINYNDLTYYLCFNGKFIDIFFFSNTLKIHSLSMLLSTPTLYLHWFMELIKWAMSVNTSAQ